MAEPPEEAPVASNEGSPPEEPSAAAEGVEVKEPQDKFSLTGPGEYLVTITKPENATLGLAVSRRRTKLVVEKVHEGLIMDWNFANPSHQVKKRDIIVDVNGITDPELILDACSKEQVLDMKLCRSSRAQASRLREPPSMDIPTEVEAGSASATLLGRTSCPKKPILASLSAEASAALTSDELSQDTMGAGRTSSAPSAPQVLQPAPSQPPLLRCPSKASLDALSPRTRSVWFRKLSGITPESTAELLNGMTRQKKVIVQEPKEVAELEDVMVTEPEQINVVSEQEPEQLVKVTEGVPESDVPDASTSITDSSESKYRSQMKIWLPPLPAIPSAVSMRSLYSAGALGKLAENHKTPGFCIQLFLLLKRSSIQWCRKGWQRALFLGLVAGAAAVLALLDAYVTKNTEWQIEPYLNLHTCLALLISVFCLGVFHAERQIFCRERDSGLGVASFYLSKILINFFDVLLQTFLMAALYYIIRLPSVPFSIFFQPFVLVAFASAGIGYFIAAIVPAQHGPFVVAMLVFVTCGLLGNPLQVATMANGGVTEPIFDILSITRWSLPYFLLTYVDYAKAHMELDASDKVAISQIELIYGTRPKLAKMAGPLRLELVFLLGMGVVWHILAFVALRRANRYQHRMARPWKQRLHKLLSCLCGSTRKEQVRRTALRWKRQLVDLLV